MIRIYGSIGVLITYFSDASKGVRNPNCWRTYTSYDSANKVRFYDRENSFYTPTTVGLPVVVKLNRFACMTMVWVGTGYFSLRVLLIFYKVLKHPILQL